MQSTLAQEEAFQVSNETAKSPKVSAQNRFKRGASQPKIASEQPSLRLNLLLAGAIAGVVAALWRLDVFAQLQTVLFALNADSARSLGALPVWAAAIVLLLVAVAINHLIAKSANARQTTLYFVAAMSTLR